MLPGIDGRAGMYRRRRMGADRDERGIAVAKAMLVTAKAVVEVLDDGTIGKVKELSEEQRNEQLFYCNTRMRRRSRFGKVQLFVEKPGWVTGPVQVAEAQAS